MIVHMSNIMQQRAQVNCLQHIKRSLNTKAGTKAGRDGPTAVVFMNMGGPGNQGEVRDFLHRLFVGLLGSIIKPSLRFDSQMETSSRSEGFKRSLQT